MESADIVAYLLVEVDAVGNDYHAVDHGLIVIQQSHKLICEPSNGVGFARTCRVLNKIAAPDAFLFGFFQQSAHHVELMIARPNHFCFGLACFLVLFFDNLCKILDYIGKTLLGEYFLPR